MALDNEDVQYAKNGFSYAKRFSEKLLPTNSSYIVPEGGQKFEDNAHEIERIDPDFVASRLRAYMREDDLSVHLDTTEITLDHVRFAKKRAIPFPEFLAIWSAYIGAFFQPFGSFLEHTEHGKDFRRKMKEFYKTGKMDSQTRGVRQSLERWFSGIGVWIEFKIGEKMNEQYGHHNFEDFREELTTVKDKDRRITERLNDSIGFRFCETLWDKAMNSALSLNQKDRVLMKAMGYADRQEEVFTVVLDRLMRKLESNKIGIEEIYKEKRPKMFDISRMSTSLETFKDLLIEVGTSMETTIWGHTKRHTENLCELLDDMGEDELAEDGRKIIETVDKSLGDIKTGEKSEEEKITPSLKRVQDLIGPYGDKRTRHVHEMLKNWFLVDVYGYYDEEKKKKMEEVS